MTTTARFPQLETAESRPSLLSIVYGAPLCTHSLQYNGQGKEGSVVTHPRPCVRCHWDNEARYSHTGRRTFWLICHRASRVPSEARCTQNTRSGGVSGLTQSAQLLRQTGGKHERAAEGSGLKTCNPSAKQPPQQTAVCTTFRDALGGDCRPQEEGQREAEKQKKPWLVPCLKARQLVTAESSFSFPCLQ